MVAETVTIQVPDKGVVEGVTLLEKATDQPKHMEISLATYLDPEMAATVTVLEQFIIWRVTC